MQLTLWTILLFLLPIDLRLAVNDGVINKSVINNSVIEVELKKVAIVSETQVKLSDLLTLRAADRRLETAMENTILGRAPRVGYQKLISRHKVLAALSKLRSAKNAWSIVSTNNSVIVKAVGESYALYDVIHLAEKQLRKDLKSQYSTFDIRSIVKQKDILRPHGKVDLRVKQVDVANVKKRMRVWVDIKVASVHYQTIPVWFAVSVQKFTLVAKHKIRSGQVLNNNMFYRKEIDVTGVAGKVVAAETLLVDKRLRVHLQENGVLTHAVLEQLPEVVAGNEVRVSVHNGSIKILTKAIALQDGHVGDTVMVSNLKSDENYLTIVVGRHQVQIGQEQHHENE